MNTCAIDIHHHYVPNSLLEEAKKNGKHLGVELADHVQFVIEAMRTVAPELGLAGAAE